MAATCKPVKEIWKDVKKSGSGCEECLKLGMQWVHLRECGVRACGVL